MRETCLGRHLVSLPSLSSCVPSPAIPVLFSFIGFLVVAFLLCFLFLFYYILFHLISFFIFSLFFFPFSLAFLSHLFSYCFNLFSCFPPFLSCIGSIIPLLDFTSFLSMSFLFVCIAVQRSKPLSERSQSDPQFSQQFSFSQQQQPLQFALTQQQFQLQSQSQQMWGSPPATVASAFGVTAVKPAL